MEKAQYPNQMCQSKEEWTFWIAIHMEKCFGSVQMYSEAVYLKLHSFLIREVEPLPTFSICSEPPFDTDYMKSELNISSNLFLYTSFLNDIDSGLRDHSNIT